MATIFCFSSTGNSLYAAKQIVGAIGGQVLPMSKKPSPCRDEVIGLVFPTYFWGLPRIVKRFISALQIENKDAYIFAVVTCGGPVFGVIGMLTELLSSKELKLHYGTMLVSVTNYLPEFKADDSERNRRKMNAKLEEIIRKIKSREENKTGGFTLINKIAYKFYPGMNSGRYFSVSSECVGCATCKKVCPRANIEMESGRPSFLNKCEHCLACLHACPAAAIDWKGKTQGKRRYRHAGVTKDELIELNRQI